MKIRKKLDENDNDNILDCLIIYVNQNDKSTNFNLGNKQELKIYKKFYKLGIALPTIN